MQTLHMLLPRFYLASSTLLVIASTAHAHHGIANFDLNKDIEISGKVTEIKFVNPHSWVYIDVAGADGSVTPWKCELRGATVLRRSGWSPEMFAPGTELSITGSPDRFEENTCYLGTAIFADGSRVDRYGQLERPAEQAPAERRFRLASGEPNITGLWAPEQRMLTDPRGQAGAFLPMSIARSLEPGAVPQGAQAFPGARGTAISLADDPIGAYWNDHPSSMPLTPAGAAAIEGFDGASSDNPRLRCEPTNILFDWTFEQEINRITQSGQTISIVYGSMGLERTIHLDETQHPANIEPSLAGHSIGRWEDDVLVVDTVGFLPGILTADGRVPHSANMHVVERFALDPETFALTRTYTADDPSYFEGQYRGRDVVFPSDLPFQNSVCEDLSYKTDAPRGGAAPWWMFWRSWFD